MYVQHVVRGDGTFGVWSAVVAAVVVEVMERVWCGCFRVSFVVAWIRSGWAIVEQRLVSVVVKWIPAVCVGKWIWFWIDLLGCRLTAGDCFPDDFPVGW